ncbi:O-antigen ligase family protein [Patescibacteria group bacterium]|nr:O-antigen ligase family protein [Patescibacteria group bacterium]MBU1015720.1 O-antigen ligase family protein [Patescibacteria group bacterium]MBU1684892.1 O-antigen ligase family protein [Patescibacteria group bacterium]MBU1938650.1 O-antigen ligase family protein [Patescibacteria group bacterium]
MNRLIRTLWKIFLFTFPFSVHFVLYEQNSYRFGNFSTWVTGFLFLPELLLILTFILWVIQKIKNKELGKLKTPGWGLALFLLFMVNAGVVTFLRGDMMLYLFFLIRVLEAGAVYVLIRQKLVPHNELITWLLYGAVFQIILAYIQTRLNHSVGLTFIGEQVIGPGVPNVAKTDLADGSKLIRPYGTFLHPNILGVYLLTIFFLSLAYLKKTALLFWVILMSVGIYLTGSQAAQLTLLITVGILLVLSFIKVATQKRALSIGLLGLIFFGNLWIYINSASLAWDYPSIQERLLQNVISINMFLHKFWGVGVGNFTLMMEQFSKTKLLPWEFQPVHNTYFLILNETGIQGLIILILIIAYLLHGYWKTGLSYFLRDKARVLPLFALIVVASFDHLLWTSWVGPILAGMVVAETTRSA